MDEYISRAKIAAEARELSTHLLNEWDTLGVLALIDRQPAADVAPVVYCKDCVHRGYKDFYGRCEGGPMCGIIGPWDYCSHGVRKEKLKDGDERSEDDG